MIEEDPIKVIESLKAQLHVAKEDADYWKEIALEATSKLEAMIEKKA